MLLDKITSSLDDETSVDLLNSLNLLFWNITIIYFTHNEHIIKNANIVYKLSKDNDNNSKLKFV